jgi:anti-sigma regulatory factor (Ser/Thr protein kinase)
MTVLTPPQIETIASTEQWLTLVLPSDLAHGDEVMSRLQASPLLEKLPWSATATENFFSAAREVLMNAIEHGGRLDPTKRVRMDLMRTSRALHFFVKDPGPGFHIQGLPHAAVNNPSDDAVHHILVREKEGLRPGGYGIMLARNFVDEMIYNEQGNEVMLVKYF